ncbi:unnamed protein product [Ilex paraguariensis]|uniref:Uncharacterized protein n=1 Tax=Ilex paraguariensis TaxID=185542 RepID=A0ABC8RX02_9AQUA
MESILAADRPSWPELVGKPAQTAATQIEKEQPWLNVIILDQKCPTTRDLRLDKVRIFIDCTGTVVKVPRAG